MTNSKRTLSWAEQLMSLDTETYENYVLRCCMSDADLYRRMSKVLCRKITTKGNVVFTNNFSSIHSYTLYRAIDTFNNLFDSSADFVEITKQGLKTCLNILAADATDMLIDPETFPQVISLWERLMTDISKEEAIAIVADTWSAWLTAKQTKLNAREMLRTGADMDVSRHLTEMEKIKERIANAAAPAEKTTFGVLDVLYQKTSIVERIPLSRTFRGLGECLGGGLGKKEHVIFVVPTGRGKTVLACQLAVETAMSKRHTLLITTEQTPEELVPRMLSCTSYASKKLHRIPFEPIRDGLTPEVMETLTEAQKEYVAMFAESTSKYLHMENWSDTAGTVDDIESVLKRVNESLPEGEEIELLILDWIGGALVTGITDQGAKRLIYKEAAKKMKILASRYNIACLSTAQANNKALGKARITSEHIAECTSLHDEAVAAFGISAMRTDEGVDEDGVKRYSYKDVQNICCFKSRKGVAQEMRIWCNFAFQRFDAHEKLKSSN